MTGGFRGDRRQRLDEQHSKQRIKNRQTKAEFVFSGDDALRNEGGGAAPGSIAVMGRSAGLEEFAGRHREVTQQQRLPLRTPALFGGAGALTALFARKVPSVRCGRKTLLALDLAENRGVFFLCGFLLAPLALAPLGLGVSCLRFWRLLHFGAGFLLAHFALAPLLGWVTCLRLSRLLAVASFAPG